jgi:hypothetical protein
LIRFFQQTGVCDLKLKEKNWPLWNDVTDVYIRVSDFDKIFENCCALCSLGLGKDIYDCFRKGIGLYFVVFLSVFSSSVEKF